MPTTERYQVDIFGIIVLIAAVLIVVFLIIAAIYFFNLMNLKPPSKGEATFLFWTTIVLALIFVGIAIYALIHIFTRKSIIYEEPKQTIITEKQVITTASPSVPAPIKQQTTAPIKQQTTAAPIKISNVPKTSRVTETVSLSDIPISQSQRAALNQELINLADITGGP